jgi:hypothetical protein
VIDGGAIPTGFSVVFTSETATMIADVRHADGLLGLGLHDSASWDALLRGAASGSGRGTTRRCGLSSGGFARLKQLRRGGLVGPLWGERFVGSRRLLRNLSLPVEAAHRGIDTPAPLGLLIVRAGPGLVRGWLAVEDLEQTDDLAALFRSGRPPTRAELACVMRMVRRMHDLGLEHRDLNLGNLLLRRGSEPRSFVIDLDSARLHGGSLGFNLRQRALRRLERSHAKSGLDASRANDYYDLYAADDTALAIRLARGRRAGRFWLRCRGQV